MKRATRSEISTPDCHVLLLDGSEIVTLDRDVARFESSRHRRPELPHGS